MQITDTKIAKDNGGQVRVEFIGEGGESISVAMSASGGIEDGAAVRRAKEMMVQVATFGIPDEDFAEAQAASDLSAGPGVSSEARTEGLSETAPVTSLPNTF